VRAATAHLEKASWRERSAGATGTQVAQPAEAPRPTWRRSRS